MRDIPDESELCRFVVNEARLLAGMLKGVKMPVEIMICPPATLIVPVGKLVKSGRVE